MYSYQGIMFDDVELRKRQRRFLRKPWEMTKTLKKGCVSIESSKKYGNTSARTRSGIMMFSPGTAVNIRPDGRNFWRIRDG